MFYIHIAFLVLWHCTCCLCKLSKQSAVVLNTDAAVAKATIYYKSPASWGEPTELLLERVEELNSKTNVKLIVHGFTGSHTHSSIAPLYNTYLALGYDNVLVADWADAAGLDYIRSRNLVAKVAQHLAKILNAFLSKHEIARSEVHIIGHSLGAHIAGDMGAFFNGTLGRVTGLDPALPLFTPTSPDSLHATDAQFVDVVHTDYPVFGDVTSRGHVDFYPHFGQATQPGCDDFDLLAVSQLVFKKVSCSHNRAVILYAESIGQPKIFPTIPCTMDAIMSRNSAACLSKSDQNKKAVIASIASLDESEVVYMGEAVSRSATGIFYLETYELPPFGQGVNTRL